MKRIILLFLATVCVFASADAQDLIVKTDSSRVEARVTEITPSEVRYKRYSNPDGPTYVLPAAAIEYIRYANGEKEFFGSPTESVPATPLTPAIPVTAAAPAVSGAPTAQPAGRYVLKKYKPGDWYDVDGVQGVVFQATEDGQHGLLMSVDQIMIRWSEFRKPDYRLTGANDRADGSVNMEKIAAYITANGFSWDDYPAFKWCREKGEGWYLPAIDELLALGHAYNGGTRSRIDRKVRTEFNEALKTHGGQRLDRLCFYYSSTEADEKSAFTSHMDIQPPYVNEIPKDNKFLVRAVRKF